MRRFHACLAALTVLFLSGTAFSNAAFAETAQPPLLVMGPTCETADCGPDQQPVRQQSFVVFEDRDGNGSYDYYTRFGCCGISYQGPWNSSIDPWNPAGGTPIATLPMGSYETYPSLSYTGSFTLMGGYTWTLKEKKVSDGALVAEWSRNPDGSFAWVFHPVGNAQGKPSLN